MYIDALRPEITAAFFAGLTNSAGRSRLGPAYTDPASVEARLTSYATTHRGLPSTDLVSVEGPIGFSHSSPVEGVGNVIGSLLCLQTLIQ